MAEGFGGFRSSEESEVSSVASVDKEKSDEELHVHLLPQEGSGATGGDTGTHIEQLQDTVEDLSSLNGEHEHGRLVHTVHSTSDPVSDELLIPEHDDELVGQVATSSHHACQEVLHAQQEKFQLELELGRRSFFEDKQKRNKKVYQSFRTHANEQIECPANPASPRPRPTSPTSRNPMTETRETEICMSEDQNGLLATAAEGESQEHFNQVEEELQECGIENLIPQDEFKTNSSYEVDSSESGIKKEFLVRHSRDRALLESLHHSNIEDELTSGTSLPGASYMESMMNYIEADRIKPHTVDDEVASRPDEHNRLSLSLLVRQDERGYGVGGSNQSLDGTTGPDCTQYSDHLSDVSMGNMAHVAAVECPANPASPTSPTSRDPMTETRETETCMSEDQNGLLATAAEVESQEHINQVEEELQGCGTDNLIPQDEIKTNSSYEGSQSPNGQKMFCDDLQQQPTDKWMRFGARPKTRPGPVNRTPQEPSLVESLTCGLPDVVHVPADSSESGIRKEFLVRHSRDRSLLESLRHSNIENISVGNMAHVAAAGSSNEALNGVLSEAESTATHLYAPGNASSTCNLLNPAGDQVAVVSEPCRAESANSRDSVSDRNTVTNAALLALAQRIQEVSVASGERQIEGQQREASVKAWNSN